MKYKVDFTKDAQKVVKKWKKSNPILFKKLVAILDEISIHPRTGIGHPEPLKGGNDITYSRRLSAHDRIIYDIHDETVTVLVIDVEGHYDDK
ncbi:txe/YoeB family addiction module toxin [Tannerella sp. oral taxon BU063 isolate Cell 5]|jgi:addiction module toxin, txe/yoeB family|uniref:Putative mRNA interferase YoeB n=1 Tax=Tannerella sp. oral taxon BU063 isolate Cell 5 TaxID=1410950 RepID=W2C9D1_9BACT|nr:txe/YoeB family addiction module toxin [Tannerella sp. oral taxon BU063 isolate Cell 5]